MAAIGETQERIIRTLSINDKPMTVKMIAHDMGVSDQTVRNHIPKLQSRGHIRMWDRLIAGASAYVLPDSSNVVRFPVTWQDGDIVSIRDLFEKLASDSVSPNPYWGNLQRVVLRLYETAILSVDDDNPQPISLIQLRELRNIVVKIREGAGNVRQAANDLLDNDDLWDHRNLTKALIIQDQHLDIEKARSIIDRIKD